MTPLEIIQRIAGRDRRYVKRLPAGVEPIAPTGSPVLSIGKAGKRSAEKQNSTPCRHEFGILEYCNECGSGAKHVRECEKHEKCTRVFVSDKVRSCDRCADYEAEVPGQTIGIISTYPNRGQGTENVNSAPQ